MPKGVEVPRPSVLLGVKVSDEDEVIEVSRRKLLVGLGALIAAPAVVRSGILMPIRGIVMPEASADYFYWMGTHYFYCVVHPSIMNDLIGRDIEVGSRIDSMLGAWQGICIEGEALPCS